MANRAASGSSSASSRRRAGLIVLNVVAVAATLAAIAAVPTGSRVVVVVAPWSEPGRIIGIVAQAGGSLVNGGAADWITIAEGDGDGFAGRLMAAGAMLVLDGRMAEACLRLGN